MATLLLKHSLNATVKINVVLPSGSANFNVVCYMLNTIERYIKERFNVILHITENDMILNKIHSKPGNILNLLILIAKQLIYRCKCQSEKVTFNMFFAGGSIYRTN